MKHINKLFLLIVLFSPGVAFALTNYRDLAETLTSILNMSLYVMMGFAVLFIAYEAYLYVLAGSDAAKRSDAKGGISYGIVALFVMISVWGFVTILISTFFSDATDYSAPVEGNGIELLSTS